MERRRVAAHHTVLLCAVVALVTVATRSARAQRISETGLAVLRQPAISPAARVGSGPGPGVVVGVDAGWSTRLAAARDPSAGAWGFGARLGYAFGNGLLIDARYDDLGVRLTDASAGPAQVGSFGARYALPLILAPFGEVRFGGAFDGASAHPAGALALGVSLALGRHLMVEAAARDWLVPASDALRSTVTFQLGLVVRFGTRGK